MKGLSNDKFRVLILSIIAIVLISVFFIYTYENNTGHLIIKNNELMGFHYGYINKFGDNKILEIPSNVTLIKKEALKGCGFIEEVIIPNSVKVIEEGAFADCNNIKKIRLPDNIDKISRFLFINCMLLEDITIP